MCQKGKCYDFFGKGVIPCVFFFGTLSLLKFIAVSASSGRDGEDRARIHAFL